MRHWEAKGNKAISGFKKNIRIGSSHWLRPPTPQFRVGDTNMLVSKKAQICVTPYANAKIALPPTRTGGIKVTLGRQRKILVLAMYISFFLVDFICIGSRFLVEYGLIFFLKSHSVFAAGMVVR